MGKTRAAAYVRQSQTHEETISPAIQREQIKAYCKSKGWELTEGVYEDVDISGRAMNNRPGLLKLRKDYEAGAFDIAVALNYSRFSRTLEDGASILGSMKLATVEEGIAESDDEFTPLLHLLLAHKFSRDLGKKWRQTHENRVKRGLPPTGAPYFGYSKNDKGEYVPNEYAPLLKKAYEDYVGGKSFGAITAEWNEAGVPTITNRTDAWAFPTLIGLMRKKFQTGVIEFKGEEFPGSHEPIISKELYTAFEARRNQNSKAPARNKYPEWPLSGLMVCGSCGGPVGMIQRNKDGATRLGCLHRRNKGTCKQKAIYRLQADHAFMLFVSQHMDQIVSALPDAETQSQLKEDVKEAEYALTAAKSKLQEFLETITVLGLSLEESKEILEARREDVKAAEIKLSEAEGELALATPLEVDQQALEHKEDMSPSEWALYVRTKLVEKCVLNPDQSFSIIGKAGYSLTQEKMSYDGSAKVEKANTQGLSREETKQARAWLRANGYEDRVSARGNIKFEFLKLWIKEGKPVA